MLTAEVNSVTALQVFQFERRNGYESGLQFRECFSQLCEVGGVGKNREVRVAAKTRPRRRTRTPVRP